MRPEREVFFNCCLLYFVVCVITFLESLFLSPCLSLSYHRVLEEKKTEVLTCLERERERVNRTKMGKCESERIILLSHLSLTNELFLSLPSHTRT